VLPPAFFLFSDIQSVLSLFHYLPLSEAGEEVHLFLLLVSFSYLLFDPFLVTFFLWRFNKEETSPIAIATASINHNCNKKIFGVWLVTIMKNSYQFLHEVIFWMCLL
jgi:hypothetical protein